VDDEWKCSAELSAATDAEGNLVNFLEVADEEQDELEGGQGEALLIAWCAGAISHVTYAFKHALWVRRYADQWISHRVIHGSDPFLCPIRDLISSVKRLRE